ncbi:MAG: hypothetical protein Q8P39_01055 [Candidatus Yanofskybacteria bacterium]|nr:hypothetical protein [Candidatus Yanofskybacteria bacterium]
MNQDDHGSGEDPGVVVASTTLERFMRKYRIPGNPEEIAREAAKDPRGAEKKLRKLAKKLALLHFSRRTFFIVAGATATTTIVIVATIGTIRGLRDHREKMKKPPAT